MGFATFLAIVLTLGLWLSYGQPLPGALLRTAGVWFVIMLVYPQRCTGCGTTETDLPGVTEQELRSAIQGGAAKSDGGGMDQ